MHETSVRPPHPDSQCLLCTQHYVYKFTYYPGFDRLGLLVADPIQVRLCVAHVLPDPEVVAHVARLKERIAQAGYAVYRRPPLPLPEPDRGDPV